MASYGVLRTSVGFCMLPPPTKWESKGRPSDQYAARVESITHVIAVNYSGERVMPSPRSSRSERFGVHRAVRSKALVLGLAIFALAAMSAVAVAASTTLSTGKASVTGKTKTVVVNSGGATLYTLSGESVGKVTRLKCVNSSCFKFWPPYMTTRTAKLTKAAGVKGTIGKLHRSKGKFYQVTLNGRPLYMFVLDGGRRGSAKGEGISSFGGTWHVASP